MDELKAAIDYEDISGKEVKVTAEVFDWWSMEHHKSSAQAAIYRKDVKLKQLGDPNRTFKPNVPFKLYVRKVKSDQCIYIVIIITMHTSFISMFKYV